MSEEQAAPRGFQGTGLPANILQSLARLNLNEPTPIQEQAIPIARSNRDVIGIAQTGTGKTFAFGLPLIEKLNNAPGKGLILAPTRELALQIEDNLRRVLRNLNTPIRTISLIGGMPIYRQLRELQHKPRLIIATPGRLQDHLDQKSLDLSDVVTLVLDEADRMLDMGFAPQINRILTSVPSDRQTMLFSATMAPEIAKIAATYMRDAVRVEVAQAGTSVAQIEQSVLYTSMDRKPELLQQILQEERGLVLVFTRTKHGAAKLSKKLIQSGEAATEIHSDRSLGQRRVALDGFKSGLYRVLVATDVAARGIDVKEIALVVNYDLPDAAEDYVHRIGRTGRAGKTGRAISFALPDQRRDVQQIERLIGKALPLGDKSELPPPPDTSAPQNRRPGRANAGGGAPRPPRQGGGQRGGGNHRHEPMKPSLGFDATQQKGTWMSRPSGE